MKSRIIVLLAVLASCIYGFIQKKHGLKIKYFDVALCGMSALLLSRLYYLIIILGNGNDEIFTVGTLGQASAYLFFLTANLHFTFQSLWEDHKTCLLPLAGTIIIGTIFLFSAIKAGNISGYIGETIYIISMCPAFYTSAKIISYRNHNEIAKGIWKFNLCVCLLIIFDAIYELSLLSLPASAFKFVLLPISIISAGIVIFMLPALKKGMESEKK